MKYIVNLLISMFVLATHGHANNIGFVQPGDLITAQSFNELANKIVELEARLNEVSLIRSYESRDAENEYTESSQGYIVGSVECGSSDNRNYTAEIFIDNQLVMSMGNYSFEFGDTNTRDGFTVPVPAGSTWALRLSRCTLTTLSFVPVEM